jgi:class 3 adenylate cyclase/tetratricopeptide (TPR) repeat protein
MARGTATVLFTDLVSSTELSVAHGAAFDEVRRAHDALLRAAVDTHGGRLIKGTGDGIMATFDQVGDGVACARDVQAAIHRLDQRHPEIQLAIRAGLSVGDVSFEDGDCYGECVIQAARLCAVADGDQILATAAIRLLTGGGRDAGFTDLGPRSLKGLPEPLDVVEVVWERPSVTATPLPARLSTELASFVGRSEELGTLHAAFRDVTEAGRRRVVLVGGEPGIGKTTMVSRAARLWFDSGATIAMGRCEEDVRAPYRPFAEALEHLVASAPQEVLDAHVARHGSGLLPLVPRLARRVPALPEPPSTDQETERFLLFAAAADLLAALSERAPVVLFLDDLHWADAGTVSLLTSLAMAPHPARVLITGTFRSDELATDHPMSHALAAFHRVEGVTRLQLGGLDKREIIELVQRWTGSPVGATGERLADDLAAETDGNAFFVTEVIRHLEETGQLSQLSQRSSAPPIGSLVPESILEVLAERVARLGSVADAVLSTAAVIGTEFTLPLLATVTGLPEVKVLDVLAEAAAAALVHEVRDAPGRFAFTHGLVQHAILLNAGPTREASLHRRVAEVLEAEHDTGTVPVAELAHHWLQATNVSDTRRARDWARQAGDAALEALAPGDALAYFRQALLLHDQLRDDDVVTRIDLLTALGTAERQYGDPEHRDTLLKACRLARRAGDLPRLAEAALANNGGTFSIFWGVDAEEVDMLEAALAGIDEPATRALLLSTLANELTYSAADSARRRALVDEALAAARASGDEALLLRVSNLAFHAIWVPDNLEERLALSEEGMRMAARSEDPVSRYWAAAAHHINLAQAGRRDEAERALDTMQQLAERLAQPMLLFRVRHRLACQRLLDGDPTAANALSFEASDLGTRAGAPEAGIYLMLQQMGVNWEGGRFAEVAGGLDRAAINLTGVDAALSLVFAEAGRTDDALELLDEVVGGALDVLPRDPSYISCLASYAEAATRLEHAGAAALVYEQLLPLAHQIGFDGIVAVGSLEHQLGGCAAVLGRHDEAIERLRRSLERHVALHAPFFEANDRYELGRVLLWRGADGDQSTAVAELRRAADLAAARGYAAIHRRAIELLATTNGA